jgi:lysophospholipase L1-like esterase
MQQILVYGDSLSRGIIPSTRRRLGFVERWSGPGMPIPSVLIVAPPPVRTPKGAIAPKFEGAAAKDESLALALGCAFVDAGTIVTTSTVDGAHLDADQRRVLAHALAQDVASLLDAARPEGS